MIDANHALAHHKVIGIDGETVRTGSFTFTKAAQEKNAENLLIIRDPVLAAQYPANWQAHAQHRQPYAGRGVVR
jgi:phosphatidylserine/phosphatidylglycerophosphate/cardiolipin synthase-like enzyme